MTAPILLHLLRHGEPALTGRLLGRTDCAVTESGIDACLGQMDGIAVDHVISSDLRRSVACAEAIGRRQGVPASRDPRWRELDFGTWDGLRTDEVDPAALARFWDDPDADPPPGGERWSALTARVGNALDALEGMSTLVVGHGGSMRAALGILCGFGQRQLWAFDLPYASLLSLRIWPGPDRTAQIVALWP